MRLACPAMRSKDMQRVSDSNEQKVAHVRAFCMLHIKMLSVGDVALPCQWQLLDTLGPPTVASYQDPTHILRSLQLED